MSQLCPFLSSWKVRSIDVLPDNKGIEIEFIVEGRQSFRFRTRKFGIGKRRARAAALAKFAAQAGFGKVEELFRKIVRMPPDTVGALFYPGPTAWMSEQQEPPTLSCVWPEDAAH